MRRFLLVVPALLLLSCGDDERGLTEPTTGTIQVRTTTAGDSPGGYTVALDGGAPQPIAIAGSVTFSDVVPGPHSVELAGLPAGCTVSGENPRTVAITAGASETVDFAVTCTAISPGSGSIRIATATTGTPPDPDGYAVAVDGGPAQPIPVAGSITVTDLTPVDHTVTLSGVAANCVVAGENPRTVSVVLGVTTEVSFAVTCGASTVGRWTRMQSGTSFALLSVWGSSAADVFTVGEPGGAFTSTIFHYNGQSWSEQFTQDGTTLTGLWGTGPTDVFAVGSDPLGAFGYDGAILRYNGSAWTPMATAGLGTGEVALHSVWGSAATDVYAVGQDFTDFSDALVAHFDGTSWSRMPLAEQSNRILLDVWGSAATDVWAVGFVDLGLSLRQRLRGRHMLFQGVSRMQSSGLILHYDGAAWTEQVIASPAHLIFAGVWSAAANDAFAVGSAGSAAVVYHWDGTSWTPMTVPPVGPLLDVWGTSGTDVYAVGDGTILHYNGTAWTEVQTTDARLTGVWGSSPADVFAVGGGGTIFHGTPAVAAGRARSGELGAGSR